MKSKTSRVMTALLLGTILLAGCSNNASTSASKKTTVTAVSHKKKSATVKNSKALWNDTKDAKLKQFIEQWAPTMGQSYVGYDGKHALKLSTGVAYPNDLKHVTVNGDNVSIGWNKKGNGNYKYNVVAIYKETTKHITYFFTFHNGKPVVLVDQSTNETPDLLPTQNPAIKAGFENIVKGKKAEVPSTTTSNDNGNSSNNNSSSNTSDDKDSDSNSSSTQSVSDPKLVGMMLYEYDRNFDMSDIPHLQILKNDDGRYYIGTGSVTSNLSFTIEGNTAHYWTVLYTGNDTRPDGTVGPSPETEHTISIADLTAKYYSTDDQKQTLDQTAAGMTVK
ncbi:hypothetical protein FD29_GL001030 [Companilactobacillus mindensis DSM 14500]|uniref:DUF4767 domain-containing protein n=1 Tax=Companilactobacillus mindensis DSM 14500 TaxID=1423770 RepID=A0A0R1QFL9_9LACO|nr:DUF4767 domain-containing protein [Companilactobacillus mindensis]KRL43345.1 hypothetical protein FD29_GL001030 [Companilactobacillus mindensis DSM 14500]GEO79831.1 hypothetical protein LMI01_21620 [Companilactobacillus mindensis]